MTDKVGEMILEQLFKIQEELKDCVKKDDLKAMEERIDKKMEDRFALQSQEIANQFHMAFESAERIHRQMEARIDEKIDMKIAQALQMQT